MHTPARALPWLSKHEVVELDVRPRPHPPSPKTSDAAAPKPAHSQDAPSPAQMSLQPASHTGSAKGMKGFAALKEKPSRGSASPKSGSFRKIEPTSAILAGEAVKGGLPSISKPEQT